MNSIDIGDPTDPVPPPSTAKLNKRRSFIRNFLPDDSSDSFSFQDLYSNNDVEDLSIIKNPFNESTSKNNFPPLDPMFETSDEESLIENQDDDDFIEEKSVEYRSAMNNRKLDSPSHLKRQFENIHDTPLKLDDNYLSKNPIKGLETPLPNSKPPLYKRPLFISPSSSDKVLTQMPNQVEHIPSPLAELSSLLSPIGKNNSDNSKNSKSSNNSSGLSSTMISTPEQGLDMISPPEIARNDNLTSPSFRSPVSRQNITDSNNNGNMEISDELSPTKTLEKQQQEQQYNQEGEELIMEEMSPIYNINATPNTSNNTSNNNNNNEFTTPNNNNNNNNPLGLNTELNDISPIIHDQISETKSQNILRNSSNLTKTAILSSVNNNNTSVIEKRKKPLSFNERLESVLNEENNKSSNMNNNNSLEMKSQQQQEQLIKQHQLKQIYELQQQQQNLINNYNDLLTTPPPLQQQQQSHSSIKQTQHHQQPPQQPQSQQYKSLSDQSTQTDDDIYPSSSLHNIRRSHSLTPSDYSRHRNNRHHHHYHCHNHCNNYNNSSDGESSNDDSDSHSRSIHRNNDNIYNNNDDSNSISLINENLNTFSTTQYPFHISNSPLYYNKINNNNTQHILPTPNSQQIQMHSQPAVILPLPPQQYSSPIIYSPGITTSVSPTSYYFQSSPIQFKNSTYKYINVKHSNNLYETNDILSPNYWEKKLENSYERTKRIYLKHNSLNNSFH